MSESPLLENPTTKEAAFGLLLDSMGVDPWELDSGGCPVHRNDAERGEDDPERFPDVPEGEDPRKRSDVLAVTNPDAIEDDYFDLLEERIEEARKAVKQTILSSLKRLKPGIERRADATLNDDLKTIETKSKQVKLKFQETNPPSQAPVGRIGQAVSSHNKRELTEDFKRVAGVDPIMDDQKIRGRLERFKQQNVNLISSVDEKYFDDIKNEVQDAMEKGRPFEEVAGVIEERTGVAKSKARTIARDQTSKLNSDLNRVRQRDNGIERYEWTSAADRRVRDSHKDLHGLIRKWSNPHPKQGHPGDAVNCRCVARGIVEDALSEGRRREVSGNTGPSFNEPAKLNPRDLRKNYNPRKPMFAKQEKLQNEWVHGSWRKEPVMMKQAIKEEFDVDGAVWNPRGHSIESEAARRKIDDMKQVVQRQYRETQRHLEEQGDEAFEVYRGVRQKQEVKGVTESWTRSKKVAEEFAGEGGHVYSETVPAERVLMKRGGPKWEDGRFGNQEEVVILPEKP